MRKPGPLQPLYRQHVSLLKALNSRLQRQPETELPEYFKNEVEYYFGSLQKGIAKAKKVRNRFAVRMWSKSVGRSCACTAPKKT